MPWTGTAPNQTFTRTDGTRTGDQTWQSADTAGVDIVPDDHDVHDTDIADGLNLAFLRNGGNTPTSDLQMGGNTFTNVGDALARTSYPSFGQMQDGKHRYVATVGGTANAITLTTGFSLSAYVAGQTFKFLAASQNTGSVTIAVDGNAAQTVKRPDGTSNLSEGDIQAGALVTVSYDGTNFVLEISSGLSDVSSDVLARIIPVGATMFWGLDTIPTGWLKAAGQAVTKTDYPELDAAYFADSYPYGASSATQGVGTMNLPPAAGRFIRVTDGGAGLDPDAATRTDRGDGTTGDNVGTIQTDDYKQHNHGVTDPGHTHNLDLTEISTDPVTSSALKSGTGITEVTESATTGITINNSGGNETRPKNIYQYLIVLASPATAAAGTLGVNGLQYVFDATITDSDPGSGNLRFDNATLGSVANIYIDNLDANGADVSGFIDIWDDASSAVKGHITVQKVGAPSNFVVFDVTGSVTDGTGYRKIGVTFIDSNGSFSASDNISVLHTPAGDKGDKGDSGFPYTFDALSTDTNADPGTGKIRLDNASFASVTKIAVDDQTTDTGNPDIAAFLVSVDNVTSTIKGRLIVQEATDKQNYIILNITSVADNAGWVEYTGTVADSNGSWADTDALSIFLDFTGDAGAAGSAGADGTSAGIPFTYDTGSVNTATDPGIGIIVGNSLTLGSITQFAIDDQSAASGNPDISAFINAWGGSTNTDKATLTIKNRANPEEFLIFNVTGVTNQTGYTQVTGTVTDTAGTWVDADTLSIEWSRSGDAGTAGAAGTDGVPGGLRWDFDDSTNTAANPGTGLWRANVAAASMSTATQLAINDSLAEAGNPDASAYIATWDDSTNATVKGHLLIKNNANQEEFAIFEVTAVSDQTTFYQITVQNGVANGTLIDADETTITFYRTGDKGADGAGSGDVIGPASASDNAIVRFDTTTGKLVQNSGITLDDTQNFAGGVGYIEFDQVSTPGTPAATLARIYTKLSGGVSKWFYVNDAGSDIQLLDTTDTITSTQTGTNTSGVTMAVGDVVATDSVTPYDATNDRPNFVLADSDAAATMPAAGVVSVGGANGAAVSVVSFGVVTGFATNAFSDGDAVFVSGTAGDLTATRPPGDDDLVQKLGTILRAHPSAGSIFVSGANRSNDIPNSMSDALFRVHDDGDITKGLRLQLSGVTTANTRTATVPDADFTFASTALTETLTNKTLTTLTSAKGGDIASASPLVIDTDGSAFDVTGTTGFSAMTVAAGRLFMLQFDAVLTMTHGATLDLPGEANITTAAGDRAIFFARAANDVECFAYTRADGTPIAITGFGAVSVTGTMSMADNILDQPVIRDYGETHNALGSIGGGTQDIDLELGNDISGTVDTSTTTFTFSNPPASGTAGSFTLELLNGGSQTVNWPASVDWAGGAAPALTAAGTDILTFRTRDGGTTWYGFAAGIAMA